jgi:hypothetical protein
MSEWTPRVAARLDEMSYNKKSLRIELQPDGDITVLIEHDGIPIEDAEGNRASVEFCNTSNGGGRSPYVLLALYGLFVALKKDAQERPDGIPMYPVGLRELMADDK